MRNLAAVYAVDEVDVGTYVASKISRAFTTEKGTSMTRFLYVFYFSLPPFR